MINLSEMEREDLEDYCLKLANDLRIANKRLSEYSWQINPDRSGGYIPPEEVEMYKRGGYGW